MANVLGIDLGIASIGFSLIDCESKEIKALGVHIFEAAENAKDGDSLAAPRRKARLLRRVIRRRAKRKDDIRRLLARHGFEGIAELFDGLPDTTPKVTPWYLRSEALERALTDEELARVLFHIAKRRGFQSNRKDRTEEGADADEKKKMLFGASELRDKLRNSGAKTIGAYLAGQVKQRNNPGSYEHTVLRDLLREETEVLFERQRAFGQTKATEALREEYEELAFWQRPIQASIEMVGQCELEPAEKRAPKQAYTAERFAALSRLKNLRILKMGSSKGRPLTANEIGALLDLAHTVKSGVKFSRARKELNLDDDERFNLAVYRDVSRVTGNKTKEKDAAATEEKPKRKKAPERERTPWEEIREHAEDKPLVAFPGYHALKSAISTSDAPLWEELVGDVPRLDIVARAFSFFEEETDIRAQLAEARLSEAATAALLESVDMAKTINLSLKALYKILPHMEEGMDYAQACAAAGYHHSKKQRAGREKLGPAPRTRNPVVDRALAQARKVINAVIRRYGRPDRIHIEFSRDLGKPKKERDEEQRENEKFRARKDLARKEAEDICGRTVSGEEAIKYRLWKEQGGYCLYSGTYITPAMLKDPLACQMDHALPRSRSWDNSYGNQVLCLSSENQQKGNRTPFEYLEPRGKWDAFLALSSGLPFSKKRKIQIKDFDEEVEGKFKERNLNDTRYMARALKNHIETSLAPSEDAQQYVLTINGRMTSMLRGRWGLGKKNRESPLEHGIDAAIVACATPAMVKRVNDWTRRPDRQDRSSEDHLPTPWKSFRDDLRDALEKVFVSRQASRKGTGQGHLETIVSGRTDKEGNRYFVKTVALTDLKRANLENIVDVEVKDGVPSGRNAWLYRLLKKRLDDDQFKNDPKKAFAEPLYMPVKDPSKRGAVIRSVKLRTTDKSLLPIPGREGYAANGSMVRADVFAKKDKFYLVPVYAHHVARRILPSAICTLRKPMDEWDKLDDTFTFVFTLHPKDYVKLEKSSGELVEGYYVGMNIAIASITLRPHDYQNREDIESIGVKTARSIRKFHVNVFGEKFLIKGEKRHGVADAPDSA